MKPQSVASELYDRTYYTKSCGDFDLFERSGGRCLARKKQCIVSLAHIRPGMRVLDAGCGRGEFSAHFARRGALVESVDYSADSVRMTRETVRRFGPEMASRVKVARCDVKHLPFPAGVFDRIVMADIVEHMHEWELREAFAEMARVLAPGGVLVVHTAPNRWRDVYNWPFKRLANMLKGKRMPKERRSKDELELHVNIQSPRMLKAHLDRCFTAKVWTMRPELLYPMSAYDAARAHDPLNLFGSRDIWALAVRPERGTAEIRKYLGESFFANRLLVVGENEWRFHCGGLGEYLYGDIVMRPVKTKTRFRIPVDGPVKKFVLAFQSEGSAELYIRVGRILKERLHVAQGTLREVEFPVEHVFRRSMVKVSIIADGGEVRLARLGFV